MALVRIDYVPETVKVESPLYVILPGHWTQRGIPVRQRKVLYLMHGLSDDGSAWQRYTSIETAADEYGLVVVMPSVGRSFYTDLPNGQAYFTYITQELPQFLSDVFNLSPAREDTLIAGNSMGGYGAFKTAFTYPERFAAAASFSGALSLEFVRAFPNDPRFAEFSLIFGDLNKLSGSEHDPLTWFKRAAQNPSALPRLYLSTGTEEDLYPINQMVYQALQEMRIPVEYHEEKAGHVWPLWDKEIRRFLAFALGS